jgi:hypothetical protein
MFPVTIGGVVDTCEGPSPLLHDSSPCKDPQLEINHCSVDSSSSVVSSPSPHHRSKDNKNAPPNSHMEHSASSPRYVVCSGSLDGAPIREPCSNQVSCPDVGNLTTVPHLSSCRWRKRRHRGRHRRRNSDNAMVTESPPNDLRLQSPSPRTTANGSSTVPTVVPSALALHSAESDVVSKSAPCDTWSFMDMISDPVSSDLESHSAERVSQTSPYKLASPPFKIYSCSSPDLTLSKDQRWSTSRSWYSQAIPFFSGSLCGDHGVTEVQCILLTEILSWRSVCIWFECLPVSGVPMEFSSFSAVLLAKAWIVVPSGEPRLLSFPIYCTYSPLISFSSKWSL